MDTVSRLNENVKRVEAATSDARAFLNGLIDDKSFVETDSFTAGMNFVDGTDALGEGVLTGYASIGGIPVCLFVQNSAVMKGSLSLAGATKIEKCMKTAARTGTPFVSVIDSAGARIGEGVGVLEGYSKLIKAASELRGVVPHIAVVKGACVGLMSVIANMSDLLAVDKKNGYVSLSSPNVVAAKEKSDDAVTVDFGAEVAARSGVSAFAYETAADLKSKIHTVLDLLSGANEESDDANRVAKSLDKSADVAGVLKAVCDKSACFELFGGRDSAVKTALARVNGAPVGIIATDGAADDGRIGQNDMSVIKKFVCLLDNFGLPLLTFVDSAGVKTCLKSEQNGFSATAADAFMAIASADIAKIAVITDKAIGLSYSLLASKSVGFDYTLAFAGASIAPLTADTAVNFMYLDEIGKAKNPVEFREKLVSEYTLREGNPFIAAKDGYVDNIIKPSEVRPYLASALQML